MNRGDYGAAARGIAGRAIVMVVALWASTHAALALDLEQRFDFDIPPQRLASALLAFSHQARIQVVVGPEVTDQPTGGVSGNHTIREALTILLHASTLSYRVVNDTSITVGAGGELGAPAPAGGVTAPRSQSRDDSPYATGSGAASREEAIAPVGAASLNEIVVTAQKRSERLQEVPVPVTALDAVALVDNNLLRLEDYYADIPGLSMAPSDLRGGPILTIRGITTGSQLNPTVGVTVDDVPYGSSTSLGGGFTVPDFDPSDLGQIEVLRGPQGTLYGADSIGGLIKFVTVDPSTQGWSGRLQADVSSVYNGNAPGYAVRGAVNAPLSDTLALRASAYTRIDPGYIDDPVLRENGVNRVSASGGRLSVLWRPGPDLSVKLSAMLQHNTASGLPYVTIQPGLGDLQQSALRNTGAYSKEFGIYTASVSAHVGPFNVTSVSGYSVNSIYDSLDLTPALASFTLASYGVPGTGSVEHNKTSKFSEELRATTQFGPHFDWLIGIFYTHENSQFTGDIRAVDPAGIPIATEIFEDFPTNFTEYAAFTDLTVHFTEQFDVQLGGRESHNRQTYNETDTGPFVALFDGVTSTTDVFPEVNSSANAFTYLVTPRYRLSPDLMLYARLASGYRAGGPNAPPGPGVPTEYAPDKTENYELGAKGDVLQHRLSFDASLYYIDWRDIQVLEVEPINGLGYIANAGRAKSQGVELSLEAHPIEGLKVAGWVAWNDAVLKDPFPPNSQDFGNAGDRLPYSSRFSANASAQDEFPLAASVRGFVGASVAYVGERVGIFTGSPARQVFPAYARTDLHAGAHFEEWTVNLFLNNATDRRGLLSGGLGTTDPNTFTFIQPRTVGLSVTRQF